MKCFYLLLALVACAAADQCADAGGECAESCGASDDVLVGRSCGTEKICCIAKAEEDDERLQKRDARDPLGGGIPPPRPYSAGSTSVSGPTSASGRALIGGKSFLGGHGHGLFNNGLLGNKFGLTGFGSKLGGLSHLGVGSKLGLGHLGGLSHLGVGSKLGLGVGHLGLGSKLGGLGHLGGLSHLGVGSKLGLGIGHLGLGSKLGGLGHLGGISHLGLGGKGLLGGLSGIHGVGLHGGSEIFTTIVTLARLILSLALKGVFGIKALIVAQGSSGLGLHGIHGGLLGGGLLSKGGLGLGLGLSKFH